MSNINIGRIPLGMYQTNCYFIFSEDSKDCLVIDPADSGDYIFEKLSENNLNVKAILLTHGHFDHIYGVKKLKELAKCPVYAYKDEEELLKDPDINCSSSVGRSEIIVPDAFLNDNEILNSCDMKIKVIHTPGHTKGSCCYYFFEDDILISGDTLFCESIGRSDLPTGSGRTLIDSVNEKLMVLPDSVSVYPGHGETTTIGNERMYNPFIN